MNGPAPQEVTRIIQHAASGAEDRAEDLLPLVYDELRRLAEAQMAREGPQTLQPTALVHEAFLTLVRNPDLEWNGRVHFFRAAAQAMRRILVNRARRAQADKRGGNQHRVTLDPDAVPGQQDLDPDQLLGLHDALERLEAVDQRQAQVVMLRYFAGLSLEEIGRSLEVSSSTAHREWEFAKAWLAREIGRS